MLPLPRIKSVYVSAAPASLLMFMAGTSCCWSSPEIPKLLNATTNPFERVVTEEEISWISSLLTLGAVTAPFLFGFLADKIGRKSTILLVGVPFFISYVMLATGEVIEVFYCARILSGIGVGGTFTMVPMYIGEIAESRNRGLISCLTGAICSFGLLFSVALGPFKTIQYFNTVLAIPPLLFLIIFSILSEESPIYLIKNQEIEQAESVLHNLGRTLEAAKKEILEIQSGYGNKEDTTINYKEMFRSKPFIKGTISSLGLLIFQQLSGINAIMFYSQTIFEQAGTKLAPQFCVIILVSVQFVSSFIVSFVVDRFGRKICLLISAVGMIASNAPLAIYCHLRSSQIYVESYSWIPVLTLTTFIIFFNFGYGPLPWTILAEMFSTNYRSFAAALVSTLCWLVSFWVTKYFGLAVATFGLGNVFLFSTFSCLLAAIFSSFYVIETKGKSLNEIQEMLDK
ncbi:facilitated trehalose transporter Tret1-like isoform X1 [Diorhabda sublineata]|uniref:facilitated trehalose transporter Tret1-like isoform X1 n=2 Tax=Diorhabda sublineata TaxID=1163346 RepID=UPI0024E13332|nr:facilitated trehalose transporter Tret1-like isoform X1 [Diorhabda sublineata]